MNTEVVRRRIFGSARVWAVGKGNRSAISKSNRRNNIATKKNRKEKGSRADFSGSKPHSYGEFFSLSPLRLGRICPATASIKEMIVIRSTIISSESIIYIWEGEMADRNAFGLKPYRWRFESSFLLRSSSVYTHVEKESNYVYEVSVSGSGFKSKVVMGREMEFD